MRALEALSDGALTKLALATNCHGPAEDLCRSFWRYFGDLIAFETARRHGMVEAADEPGIPQLPAEELEGAALALGAMAGEEASGWNADRALAAWLMERAEELVLMRSFGILSDDGGQGN